MDKGREMVFEDNDVIYRSRNPEALCKINQTFHRPSVPSEALFASLFAYLPREGLRGGRQSPNPSPLSDSVLLMTMRHYNPKTVMLASV
jgi:hypothetical protein